jgi:hypothetical protein
VVSIHGLNVRRLIGTAPLLKCLETPYRSVTELQTVFVKGCASLTGGKGWFPGLFFFFFYTFCLLYSVLVIILLAWRWPSPVCHLQWKKNDEVKSMILCCEVRLGDDTWYWSVGKQPLAFGCEFSGLICLWIQNMLINGHNRLLA